MYTAHNKRIFSLSHPLPFSLVHFSSRTETLIDTLVRGIKKSQGGERKELLLLASLFSLQFGEDCADITPLLLSVLVPIIMDNSVSPPERSMVSLYLYSSLVM